MATSAATINIYFPRFFINTDPHTMMDARSMQVNLQLHRGLFRYLPDGSIQPDLASYWRFSSDKKTLEVKLKNATFSDGTVITANHVADSFARIFVLGSSISADLRSISGGRKLKQFKDMKNFGVKATSANTLEFKLDYPSAIFIQQLATVDCAVLPITDVRTQVFGSSPWVPHDGAGPYKILSNKNDEILLEKWRKDDFDSKNPPDKIRIFLTEMVTTQPLIELIGVDSLDQAVVSASEKLKLKQNDWQEIVTDLTREHFLILNPKRISPSLRRELIEALNINLLTQKMGAGFSPAYGLIPPVLSGAIKKSKNFHTEKKLKNKQSKHIEVLLPSSWEHAEKLKDTLKDSVNVSNVELRFKIISPQDWNKAKLDKNYDVLINSRGIDYPDGISILNYFRSGVEGNYYFCSDKEIDKMLDLATQEFDVKKRSIAYRKIQQAILAKNVVVPLFFGSQASGLWGPRVKFIPAHPLGFHFLPFEMIEMR